MNKTIVTTGEAFCDIDSLACAIAYTELLNKTGQPATAFIPGPLNYSVGKMAETLVYEKTCPAGDNKFVVVDVSNPDRFPKEVKAEKVVEIFDHHPDFEKFWSDRLGEKSHIEIIGACATLIWETFVSAGIGKDISKQSANLLSVAIASNTLNFGSPITSPRDRQAFAKLIALTDLSAD